MRPACWMHAHKPCLLCSLPCLGFEHARCMLLALHAPCAANDGSLQVISAGGVHPCAAAARPAVAAAAALLCAGRSPALTPPRMSGSSGGNGVCVAQTGAGWAVRSHGLVSGCLVAGRAGACKSSICRGVRRLAAAVAVTRAVAGHTGWRSSCLTSTAGSLHLLLHQHPRPARRPRRGRQPDGACPPTRTWLLRGAHTQAPPPTPGLCQQHRDRRPSKLRRQARPRAGKW